MKQSIEDLFSEFMWECEFVRKVKNETVRGYRQAFTTFLKLTPEATLETLSSSLLIRFFKNLQERKRMIGKGRIKVGVKRSTVANYWCKLNAFFKWLLIHNKISENPFGKMEFPEIEYVDKRFLKRAEIEKILTAIQTHNNNNLLLLKRNLAIFHVLLFCGLRREEVVFLQVRDIDFERRILTIRGETSKSGRTRHLPLHSTAIMYIKDYIAARRKYTTPYLFVSTVRDEGIKIPALLHYVKKLSQYSGVSFHLHRFRHTFAVNFLISSNNVVMLKELLGHKDIKMTMTYLRCIPASEMRSNIELLNIDRLI